MSTRTTRELDLMGWHNPLFASGRRGAAADLRNSGCGADYASHFARSRRARE